MRGKTWITWLEVSNSALEMASSMASSATRVATVSVSAMLCSKCENVVESVLLLFEGLLDQTIVYIVYSAKFYEEGAVFSSVHF